MAGAAGRGVADMGRGMSAQIIHIGPYLLRRALKARGMQDALSYRQALRQQALAAWRERLEQDDPGAFAAWQAEVAAELWELIATAASDDGSPSATSGAAS
jgi:hypothetical protein